VFTVLDSRLLLSLLTEIELSIEKRPLGEIRSMLSQAHDCAIQLDRRIRVDLAAPGRQNAAESQPVSQA
jgi:hypothetical protein